MAQIMFDVRLRLMLLDQSRRHQLINKAHVEIAPFARISLWYGWMQFADLFGKCQGRPVYPRLHLAPEALERSWGNAATFANTQAG